MGVTASFLMGRLERGSEEVGIDSGIGSDMMMSSAGEKEPPEGMGKPLRREVDDG